MEDARPPQQRRFPDAVRAAVERTVSSLGDAGATSAAGLPGDIADRAGELLDEVARRGRDVRTEIARHGEEIARRGQGAVDASAGITARVIVAVADTLRAKSKPEVEGD